ncbi:hypothetical protein [Synechococcus elongatus]|uniref:hypothetical protein n=1 Tax=Synechococcus elongatus TaxID=32046 RepID=UPI000F7D9E10|nr:hypothetical protein [Synechococcus elongatus]
MSFLLSSFSVVGFSGSRAPSPASLSAVAVALSRLSPSAAVLVGCAAGVDQAVRQSCPRASVFSASQFGSGRGSFAARSVAFVRSLAAASGCLVSFPSGACPVAVVPSARPASCFCGSGSGSWASAAFAVGLGVPVLLFASAVPAWGFVSLGRGWWLHLPAVVQSSLL